METEPTVESQWDAYTSGAETETGVVNNSTEPVETTDAWVETEATDDGQTADPIPDNDDDLLGDSTGDYDSIRQEMAALKQQFEQERLQYQEALRRAQQSFRDTGASLLERVEQRLEPVQQTLADLVRQGLLSNEDANARLGIAQRQFTKEEIAKDKQEREFATRQQWLAQQQPNQQPAPQSPQGYSPAEVQRAQAQIQNMTQRFGLTMDDYKAAGAPSDLSHLSPIEAVEAWQKWTVATAKMKQAMSGNPPQRNGNRQFPYPDMGGGAGVVANNMASITRELEAEMVKPNPNWDRITELNNALQIPTNS
jgi:hypothetical protein